MCGAETSRPTLGRDRHGMGKLVSFSGGDASCDTHANIVRCRRRGGGTAHFRKRGGLVAAPHASCRPKWLFAKISGRK